MTTLLDIVGPLVQRDTPGRAPSWSDVVVLGNESPLPSPHPGTDSVWNRGVLFLVLDATGRPEYFGRCHSRHNARAERSSAIRAALGDDPELNGFVPRTRFAGAGALLVELSRYVTGSRFEREIPTLASAAWAADAERIITAVGRTAECAEQRIPLLRGDGAAIDLGVAAGPALAFLASAGLPTGSVAALAAVLAGGGTVRPRIQHGDLWPGNVLRSHGSFVLLDFEVFGDERVPMYDVFHLLRSCLMLRARPGDEAPLLAMLRDDTPDVVAFRRIVRQAAAHDQLSDRQAVATFAFYLAEMTAKIRGRDAPEAYWRPYWHCLVSLANRLQAGTPIAPVLLGPPGPRSS